MDFVILILLIVIIILLILVYTKKDSQNDLIERLGKLEKNVNNDLNNFKFDISKFLVEDFNKLNQNVEDKLLLINEKVNERID